MAATERPPALAAVLAACAALQALPLAAQDSGERFSLRLHEYDEAGFDGALADGSPQRYTVKTAQAALQLSLRGEFLLNVDALAETMSGSSPWFILPDAGGDPQLIFSGASIADRREELALALSSPLEQAVRHSLRLHASAEDDYHALAAGYEHSRALDPQHTLSLGLQHSADRLSPTDAALFGRIAYAEKRSSHAFLGLTQVLDRNRQQQFGLSFERASGFLSDPYKQVLVGPRLLADRRPPLRQQWAAIWRYRQALADGRAALHLDYQFSRDDWGIRAHNLELRWLGEFGEHYQWGPSLRYYSQSAAAFYAPFLGAARSDGWASCDYRLGRFGAFSLGLQLRRQFGALALSVSAEAYRSDEAYALGGAGAAVPALVDFRRLSLGLDWAF